MIHEIVKATTDTMKEHEGIGRVSGYLKNTLQGDVVNYLEFLKREVEKINDRILDLQENEAGVFATARDWCKIAREHADAATGSASNLLGARSPNAQNLIDVTADGVRMTTEWSEGMAGNPEKSIPESVFEHFEGVMEGLDEAIRTIRAKADEIHDQGKLLAERSSDAGNSFLSET